MLSAGGSMAINRHYLKPETQLKIKEIFLKEKKVILFNFFDDEYYQKMENEIQKLKFKHEQEYLTHCYGSAVVTPIIYDYFKDLVKVIGFIINKKTTTSSWKIKALCFSWKDYIILHDENKEEPGIDILLDFTDGWKPEWGGAVTYVDGTGDYTKIPIQGNMLALVQRTNNEQRFVQYVNHYAGKRKRILLLATI
jgi:Rps23 Pro-64 3,4-dihydroxylase Tpa1-like proline 4-hydroxylase